MNLLMVQRRSKGPESGTAGADPGKGVFGSRVYNVDSFGTDRIDPVAIDKKFKVIHVGEIRCAKKLYSCRECAAKRLDVQVNIADSFHFGATNRRPGLQPDPEFPLPAESRKKYVPVWLPDQYNRCDRAIDRITRL